jgi:predicted secreted protein
MSNTSIGHGTKFSLMTTPPGTYTDIKGVLSVEFGSDKTDQIDTTAFDTPGNTRTYDGGLNDPAEVTIKGRYIPGDTSQTTLRTAKDGTVHSFKVTYPGGTITETFDGIITEFSKTIPDDQKMEFTVKVKMSGASVIA